MKGNNKVNVKFGLVASAHNLRKYINLPNEKTGDIAWNNGLLWSVAGRGLVSGSLRAQFAAWMKADLREPKLYRSLSGTLITVQKKRTGSKLLLTQPL